MWLRRPFVCLWLRPVRQVFGTAKDGVARLPALVAGDVPVLAVPAKTVAL